MFNYVNDISSLSHKIIEMTCKNFNTAIDGTLGNGYDTDFLSKRFSSVFAFEIQEDAIERYRLRAKENVVLIKDSHENFERYIDKNVECIVYNLGFLPGGNKAITTKKESTLKSINSGLQLLNSGGIMLIGCYSGHEEGMSEKLSVLDFVSALPKKDYGVLLHSFINRTNEPPALILIEKNAVT